MNYFLSVVLLLMFTINYCDLSSLGKREVELQEDLYKNDDLLGNLLPTVEKLLGQVSHLLVTSLGDVLKIVNSLLTEIEGLLVGNNQLSEAEKNNLKELESALKNIDTIVKKQQEIKAGNGSHY